MRIKGLVRVFNQVRSQLQAGLHPHEVEAFRKRVEGICREVEEICRAHGMTPDRLPGPSRLAYLFLKELDLDNLPIIQAGEVATATPTFRIKNVVKIGEHFADRLWQQLTPLREASNARTQLKQEIGKHISMIEQICVRHMVTPSALEMPSRQAYCWLKFMWSEENLLLHLEALERARNVLNENQLRLNLPVHVQLISMNALWRKRQYQNAVLVKVNEGFLNADTKVWRAVIHNTLLRSEAAREQLVREFAESDDFSEVLFEIESFAASPTASTQGRAHHLDESFARVNTAYFGGSMSKPTLVWNRTLTARKFGHYQPSRDTLMVSVSLDDTRIPAYVVDFVMYHELLHKKHGVMTVNGRRLAHSPGFRADERQFAEYHEAERQLNELALRQRGASGLIVMEEPNDSDS